MKQLLHETDWLASEPYFYNTASGEHSGRVNDVIEVNKPPIVHPEGMYNFLDFGYSVYGQTPLRDIKFMRHSTKLYSVGGQLQEESGDDPFDRFTDYHLSETDIIDLVRERVQAWEASLPSNQEIVLPLSGGYDSRLLLWCIKDKSRVRAYTYGVSQDQSRSTEVVHAKWLADRYGVRWQQVELGDFHSYFDEWDANFGVSTHAHGMYHFEFYSRIRENLSGRQAFLSGIFGDVWAGSIPFTKLNGPDDLIKLGYTHGLRADPTRMCLSADHALRDQFWSANKAQLQDHRFQTITTIRLKLMLISYLTRVPQLFDFEPWTPYLDIDVALAMLNLPQARRKNRQWQKDFFAKEGLDLEADNLPSSRRNSLNIEAIRRIPPRPLDASTLSSVIDPDYVEWISKHIAITTTGDIHRALLGIPKIGGILRRTGVHDRTLEAYCAYLCLRPIENALRSANQ